MARIRSTHPDQWTDEDFFEMSFEARLLAIGIRNFCDDKGCFKWRPKTIKSRVLPADNVDIVELLSEMEDANIVRSYEINGVRYGAIRNFRKFQSPQKPNDIHPLPYHMYTYVGMRPPNDESGTLPDPPEPASIPDPEDTSTVPVQDQSGNSSLGRGEERKGIGEERGSGGKPDGDPPDDDPPKPKRARGARLPEDFALPKDWGDWAVSEGIPSDQVRVEAAKFTDHWHAASGQSASKRDWKAAWRNWIRRSVELNPGLRAEQAKADPDDAPEFKAASAEIDLAGSLGLSDTQRRAAAHAVAAGKLTAVEAVAAVRRIRCRDPGWPAYVGNSGELVQCNWMIQKTAEEVEA